MAIQTTKERVHSVLQVEVFLFNLAPGSASMVALWRAHEPPNDSPVLVGEKANEEAVFLARHHCRLALLGEPEDVFAALQGIVSVEFERRQYWADAGPTIILTDNHEEWKKLQQKWYPSGNATVFLPNLTNPTAVSEALRNISVHNALLVIDQIDGVEIALNRFADWLGSSPFNNPSLTVLASTSEKYNFLRKWTTLIRYGQTPQLFFYGEIGSHGTEPHLVRIPGAY